MMIVMPYVSTEWRDRIKGKHARQQERRADDMSTELLEDYVSASDFAYVPVIVAIYGKKELEMVGEKRGRGRVKGQSGMTCKQNISLYIESLIRMKAILEEEENRNNVISWSNAIFSHIENKTMEQPDGPSEAMLDRIRAAEQTKRDIRKMKKDEILIPV
jgi:hypothetical protein